MLEVKRDHARHRRLNNTSPFKLSHQCRPQLLARLFSPYDLDPGGSDPLRGILAECTDFERLGRAPIKKFVTAANVRTGQGRLFRSREVTPDVLLASTCLPTTFQAFEIDGENYWDGGDSSKLNAERDFLCMQRDAGRRSANSFLDAHGADLEWNSS